MTIFRQYHMKAVIGRGDDLKIALKQLAQLVISHEGCEGVQLLVDCKDSGVFQFTERWTSRSHYDIAGERIPQHIFSVLSTLLAVLPEGHFLESVFFCGDTIQTMN